MPDLHDRAEEIIEDFAQSHSVTSAQARILLADHVSDESRPANAVWDLERLSSRVRNHWMAIDPFRPLGPQCGVLAANPAYQSLRLCDRVSSEFAARHIDK